MEVQDWKMCSTSSVARSSNCIVDSGLLGPEVLSFIFYLVFVF